MRWQQSTIVDCRVSPVLLLLLLLFHIVNSSPIPAVSNSSNANVSSKRLNIHQSFRVNKQRRISTALQTDGGHVVQSSRQWMSHLPAVSSRLRHETTIAAEEEEEKEEKEEDKFRDESVQGSVSPPRQHLNEVCQALSEKSIIYYYQRAHNHPDFDADDANFMETELAAAVGEPEFQAEFQALINQIRHWRAKLLHNQDCIAFLQARPQAGLSRLSSPIAYHLFAVSRIETIEQMSRQNEHLEDLIDGA